MKNRTFVAIPIIVLAVVVILIFASCDNAVTPLFEGTWVNSDYDGMLGGPIGEGFAAKMVIKHIDGNDYTCDLYTNHDETTSTQTVLFTVTNEWTDSEGNLFIEALTTIEPDHPDIYGLSKLHADNQTMETNSSLETYPTEIDPAGWYGIYYRQ